MGNLPCVSRGSQKEPIERLQYNMRPVIEKHLPIYWIIGTISSGKTKQAEKLAEVTRYNMVVVKKLYKDEASQKNDRGRFIKERLDKALEIPTEITVDLVKEEILKYIEKSVGYILVGFPQTLPEADMFIKEVYKPQVIFYLNVKFTTIMDRLSNQESSLAMSTVQDKLTRFRKDVKNIRAVFDHKIEKIDANVPVDQVFGRIQTILKDRFDMDFQPSHVEGHYQEGSTL